MIPGKIETVGGAMLLRLDSLGEALARTLEPKAQNPKCQTPQSRTNPKMRDWDLSAGWSGMLTLAREGWPEGRDQLRQGMAAARVHVTRQRAPAMVRDVAGFRPDVPRAIVGDPASMWRRGAASNAARPVLTLNLEIGASGAISSAVMRTRGAALLSEIDALEDNNIRCEIWAAFTGTFDGKISAPIIRAKRADEPLDIDRLAFLLTHPAASRRLMFGLSETMPHPGDFYGGYGSPAELPAEALHDETAISVYAPSLNLDGTGPRSANSWNTPEKAQVTARAIFDAALSGIATEEEAP